MNEVNIETVSEYMIDWCSELYEGLRGKYPEFLISAWQDQVDIAKAINGGANDDYNTAMAQGFAGEQDLLEWSGDVIEQNHVYVQARVQLAGFYKQAVESITTTPPEQLPVVLQGLLSQGFVLATALAGPLTPEEHNAHRSLVEFGTLLQETTG